MSYGRLREACQTGLDGTSIDALEVAANQLGLEAEQIMLPADHVLFPEGQALPAIIVVKLPTGLTHFVVAWRLHGNLLQVMDPAVGRRWVRATRFVDEIYRHVMPASAAGWREFAASEDFQSVLRARLGAMGIGRTGAQGLARAALSDGSWRGLGALDAAVRMVESLRRAGALTGAREAQRLIERLCAHPDLVPPRYWSVHAAPPSEGEEEQVLMCGAVVVRIRGKHAHASSAPLDPVLAAAVQERPLRPGRELLRLVWKSGPSVPGVLVLALAAAAAGVLVEALLFRGLFDITGELGLAGQRLGAMAAILLFSLALLLLELPVFLATARIGRQIENRLRLAFLAKIPKLGDRYFQSRLTSDMAERSHATHRLRHLPDLAREFLRSLFELCATAASIVWLEPSAAPFVFATALAAVIPAFVTQPMLAERDLRVRSHAAGLTRFYLDAMLGLFAVRAHNAGRSVRREHEKLLNEWAAASLRLQGTVARWEAAQLALMFGLVAALLLFRPLQGTDVGRVLLIVYWALNLPALGQDIAALARQYPFYRNVTLRLLDPLGAPEEAPRSGSIAPLNAPPALEFREVRVTASGHTILDCIDLRIEPGQHVAIVGPSGAGKSSLVGLLLGWWKPSEGEVLVNGAPVNCDLLRRSTAWVDPAVQLWNRSLFSNLCYGSEPEPTAVGKAVDAVLLRGVLESLPAGFETRLGEGGGLVSGGEGQRVRLGRAMLRREAKLVILDEPFRGLDREKRRELLVRAREFWRASTLLCITHDLSETESFDRVLVVEAGRIVEDGTPAELCASPASRYSQLLEAEQQARTQVWEAGLWRRIRIHSGRIVEEHKSLDERRRETEVA